MVHASSRIGRVLSLAVLLHATGSAPGAAQEPAGTGTRVLLRQLYGDVGIELRSGAAGAILIGAAGTNRTVTLSVLARDLLRWTDSATRVLSRVPSPAGKNREGRWQAMLEGPGLEAGAMTMTREVTARDTAISVYFADTEFAGVRAQLSTSEARAFVAALRRAANAVLAPPPRKPAPFSQGARP